MSSKQGRRGVVWLARMRNVGRHLHDSAFMTDRSFETLSSSNACMVFLDDISVLL